MILMIDYDTETGPPPQNRREKRVENLFSPPVFFLPSPTTKKGGRFIPQIRFIRSNRFGKPE
jgi:hypothetical protein